jgi:ABC-2 type transport system ATP-binding protein
MPILTFQDVSVRYGRTLAVDRLTLAVEPGECFGLLGPNGSGKSSSLAVAAGAREPCSGTAAVAGLRRRDDPFAYARLVGVVPQELALYDELSATDNLAVFGRLYGLAGRELKLRIAEALDCVGLADLAAKPVRACSGGQQRRVNIACALLHRPKLLLLDEPTVGVDDQSRLAIFTHLRGLAGRGVAVVLTTHHLQEAERFCDRVAVLDGGQLMAVGTLAELDARLRPPPTLEAELTQPLDAVRERQLADRLGPRLALRTDGLSLRLEAADQDALNRGLTTLLLAGVALASFRTPPPSLERVLRAWCPVPGGAPCPAN